MKGFLGLTKRNILLFFKDKQSVIFSLLTSIIVLALYLLFLKSSFIDAINGILEAFGALSLVEAGDVNMIADTILLTGIVGSAMITVPYNCLTTVVKDRESKIDYDILATPIKRGSIVLSYFVSAAVSAVLLTSVILTAGLLLIGSEGDLYMTAADIALTYAVVAFGSVSATAFFMILILLFKTSAASGAFFGMLSAASGFVIGAYIPISQFSGSVQTVCNLFPASQITIILRNMLMNGLLSHLNDNLSGIDGSMFEATVKEVFSFKAHLFESDLAVNGMLVYVLAALLICLLVQVVLYNKTYKKN